MGFYGANLVAPDYSHVAKAGEGFGQAAGAVAGYYAGQREEAKKWKAFNEEVGGADGEGGLRKDAAIRLSEYMDMDDARKKAREYFQDRHNNESIEKANERINLAKERLDKLLESKRHARGYNSVADNINNGRLSYTRGNEVSIGGDDSAGNSGGVSGSGLKSPADAGGDAGAVAGDTDYTKYLNGLSVASAKPAAAKPAAAPAAGIDSAETESNPYMRRLTDAEIDREIDNTDVFINGAKDGLERPLDNPENEKFDKDYIRGLKSMALRRDRYEAEKKRRAEIAATPTATTDGDPAEAIPDQATNQENAVGGLADGIVAGYKNPAQAGLLKMPKTYLDVSMKVPYKEQLAEIDRAWRNDEIGQVDWEVLSKQVIREMDDEKERKKALAAIDKAKLDREHQLELQDKKNAGSLASATARPRTPPRPPSTPQPPNTQPTRDAVTKINADIVKTNDIIDNAISMVKNNKTGTKLVTFLDEAREINFNDPADRAYLVLKVNTMRNALIDKYEDALGNMRYEASINPGTYPQSRLDNYQKRIDDLRLEVQERPFEDPSGINSATPPPSSPSAPVAPSAKEGGKPQSAGPSMNDLYKMYGKDTVNDIKGLYPDATSTELEKRIKHYLQNEEAFNTVPSDDRIKQDLKVAGALATAANVAKVKRFIKKKGFGAYREWKEGHGIKGEDAYKELYDGKLG